MFNLDEFDESTVTGWSASLHRILASAVGDPDQDWKALGCGSFAVSCAVLVAGIFRGVPGASGHG
jgi:hypothetical protein